MQDDSPSDDAQLKLPFTRSASERTAAAGEAPPSSKRKRRGPEGLRSEFRARAHRVRLIATELPTQVGEPGAKVSGPEDAGEILADLIGNKDREHFVVLHLDTRHRVRAAETASIGSLNAAVVHPREVFKAAILANSAAIICGHNHPSGDLTPSDDDVEIHRRLYEAGKLLGIEVLDFLVVSASRCWSMRSGNNVEPPGPTR